MIMIMISVVMLVMVITYDFSDVADCGHCDTEVDGTFVSFFFFARHWHEGADLRTCGWYMSQPNSYWILLLQTWRLPLARDQLMGLLEEVFLNLSKNESCVPEPCGIFMLIVGLLSIQCTVLNVLCHDLKTKCST